MKTLKVTLKQHTPLIHFQHDQYGATLRASEVKPKLDKFIIEKVFSNEWEQCKKYLVGYKKSRKQVEAERVKEEISFNQGLKQKFNEGYRALNYKLIINPLGDIEVSLINEPKIFKEAKHQGKPYKIKDGKKCLLKTKNDGRTIIDLQPYPLFFGNMDKDIEDVTEYRKMVFTKKPIELKVCVEVDGLYEYLDSHLNWGVFFLTHNFGTRQSKGFGSFYIAEESKYYVEPNSITFDANEVYNDNTFFLSVERNKKGKQEQGNVEITNDEIKQIFNVIDLYWKCLKSGVNNTKRKVNPENGKITREKEDLYVKSYLFQFLNEKGLTWEKKKVKTELDLVCDYPEKNEIMDDKPSFFARAHLGCPIGSILYKVPYISWDKKENKHKEKYNFYTVKISSEEIDRIQAPIIFKPIIEKDKVYIYILYNDKLINTLNKLDKNNISFRFDVKKNREIKTTEVPLFQEKNNVFFHIDYENLIRGYHDYLTKEIIPKKWSKLCTSKITLGKLNNKSKKP